jgi:hypothetical protein
MKRFLVIFLLLLSFQVRGDIIFFPFYKGLYSYSIEGIYSFEKNITKRMTKSYWCGTGIVGNFFYPQYHAEGLEAGFELRRYFKKDKYKGLNIGIYFGPAFMVTGHQQFKEDERIIYFGVIPGLKLTYKAKVFKSFYTEPYLSASIPWYINMSDNKYHQPSLEAYFTIGVRICFIKFKNTLI